MKNKFHFFITLIRSGLFKRTFIYTLSVAINAMVAFLLIPIMTRYLSPYDYGIVETYMTFGFIVMVLLPMGGDVLLSRDYFKLNDGERGQYIGGLLGLTYVTGIIVLLAILAVSIFSNSLSNFLKIDNWLIFAAIIMAFPNAIISIILKLFQLEKKARTYAIFLNSKTIIEVVLSLFFVVAIGMQWKGRISGIVISTVIYWIVALIILRRQNIKSAWPARYAKQNLLLGIPLVVAMIAGWLNEACGKLLINNLIDVSSTGLYSVGLRFGMVIMVAEIAFSRAWLPYFFENVKENKMENKLKIVKATYLYISLLILFSVSYGVLGKYLLHVMVDERFYTAGQFIFLISMAYCFDGIWKMFDGYLVYRGKTKTYANIVFISAVINILATYFLLKHIGLIGAAWALFISYATGALVTIIMAHRAHPMPWLYYKPFRVAIPDQ